MNLLIVGVSYKTDEHALRFYESLVQAVVGLPKSDSVTVVIVDSESRSNALESRLLERQSRLTNLRVRVVRCRENVGYFGGARAGVAGADLGPELYDYVCVSNVDLVVDPCFFTTLVYRKTDRDVGVLAPSIVSLKRKADLNPKLEARVPSWRYRAFRITFSSRWLFIFHSWISTLSYSSGVRNTQRRESRDIYAAHGSFFIFTKNFFMSGGALDYPVFLFGEEIFVAEICLSLGMRVVYDPDLQVQDVDHASTGAKTSEFKRVHYLEALNYVREKYYS